MNDCMYCAKDERLTNLMTEVIRLDLTTVYLYREQSYPGRCVVAMNRHVHKLTDLTPEEHAVFCAEVSKSAKVWTELYQPGKINYLVMGDMSPHLHIHLVPKYPGGTDWGTMFQMMPEPQKYLSAEEEAAEVAKIRKALEA